MAALSGVITRLIARHGVPATVQLAGAGAGGSWLDVPVTAHFVDADPAELVPGATATQFSVEVRVAQRTLDANGATRLPRQGDRILRAGKTLAILSVESKSVRMQSALIVMRARG